MKQRKGPAGPFSFGDSANVQGPPQWPAARAATGFAGRVR